MNSSVRGSPTFNHTRRRPNGVQRGNACKAEPQPVTAQESIGGLGGAADSIIVETQIRLTRETSAKVVFRGRYAAVTELASLDIDVLGRDITGLFTVIVDQPGDVVCMLGQRHRYSIEQI